MFDDILDGDSEIIEALSKAIHYPDCWDTMAYPSLYYALLEMLGRNDCPTCGMPQCDPEQEAN